MSFQNAPEPDCLRKDAFGNCLPTFTESMKPHKGFYSHKKPPRNVKRGGVRGDPISSDPGDDPGGPGGPGGPVARPPYNHPSLGTPLTGRQRRKKDMYIGYYSHSRELPNRRSSVPLDVQEKALDFTRMYERIDIGSEIKAHNVRGERAGAAVSKLSQDIKTLERQIAAIDQNPEASNFTREELIRQRTVLEKNRSKFGPFRDKWRSQGEQMVKLHDDILGGEIFQNHRSALRAQTNFSKELRDIGIEIGHEKNRLDMQEWDLNTPAGRSKARVKPTNTSKANQIPTEDLRTSKAGIRPRKAGIRPRNNFETKTANADYNDYINNAFESKTANADYRGDEYTVWSRDDHTAPDYTASDYTAPSTELMTEAEMINSNNFRKRQAAEALEQSVKNYVKGEGAQRPHEYFTDPDLNPSWNADWDARHHTTPEQKNTRINKLLAEQRALQNKHQDGGVAGYESPKNLLTISVEGREVNLLHDMHLEVNVEGDVLHVNIPGEIGNLDLSNRKLIAQDTTAAMKEIKTGLGGERGEHAKTYAADVEGLRYKSLMKAVDHAIETHPNIKQVDIAGHSYGGFMSRIATPDVAEMMSTKYPKRNIKVKGMGLNAFVRDPKNLPAIPKNAEFTYHEIMGDYTSFKQGSFLAQEARNGANTNFYPQSSDAGNYKGPSLFKNTEVNSPFMNAQRVRNNLGKQFQTRHQAGQFVDARTTKTRLTGENHANAENAYTYDRKYTPEVEAGLAPGAPALNRDLPVRTNELGQLENFNPSAAEDVAGLHSLNIKYPNAAAAAEGVANFGYGAAAGILGAQAVEAIDPNRQEKVRDAANAMTSDFKEGKVSSGLKEAAKMTGQEAIHTGEYGLATGAIDAAGRGLFGAAKAAVTGGGAEAAVGSGLSAAGAAFLPTTAAIAGGMVVSEGTKALMEWGGDELGIDENIVEPTSEIVADAAGGAAGAAIAGAVAAGMGYGAAAGPMGVAAGAAIGALVGGGVELYKHWDDVSNYMSDNLSNIKSGLVSHIDDIGGFINHLF